MKLLTASAIEDQLHEDLTVARIARAVHMSRFHFKRLFKKGYWPIPVPLRHLRESEEGKSVTTVA